jgi:hypothetical protein
MAQIPFSSDTTPANEDLDANFAELYAAAAVIPNDGANASLHSAPTLASDGSWYSLQVLGGPSWSANGPNTMVLATNMGNTVAAPHRIAAAPAAYYQQSVGLHIWATAATGAAGSAITWTEVLRLDAGGNAAAGTDNTQSWGISSKRWSTIYAGTGTINTSDAREKTAVTALTTSELAAAKALSAEIGTYQWLAAVQEKGADARSHIGLTVQRAIEIMTAGGLDPMAYGFICYDAWPEVRDEGGNVTQSAGDRYAFRPDELLLFIARGLDARLAALEGH